MALCSIDAASLSDVLDATTSHATMSHFSSDGVAITCEESATLLCLTASNDKDELLFAMRFSAVQVSPC